MGAPRRSNMIAPRHGTTASLRSSESLGFSVSSVGAFDELSCELSSASASARAEAHGLTRMKGAAGSADRWLYQTEPELLSTRPVDSNIEVQNLRRENQSLRIHCSKMQQQAARFEHLLQQSERENDELRYLLDQARLECEQLRRNVDMTGLHANSAALAQAQAVEQLSAEFSEAFDVVAGQNYANPPQMFDPKAQQRSTNTKSNYKTMGTISKGRVKALESEKELMEANLQEQLVKAQESGRIMHAQNVELVRRYEEMAKAVELAKESAWKDAAHRIREIESRCDEQIHKEAGQQKAIRQELKETGAENEQLGKRVATLQERAAAAETRAADADLRATEAEAMLQEIRRREDHLQKVNLQDAEDRKRLEESLLAKEEAARTARTSPAQVQRQVADAERVTEDVHHQAAKAPVPSTCSSGSSSSSSRAACTMEDVQHEPAKALQKATERSDAEVLALQQRLDAALDDKKRLVVEQRKLSKEATRRAEEAEQSLGIIKFLESDCEESDCDQE